MQESKSVEDSSVPKNLGNHNKPGQKEEQQPKNKKRVSNIPKNLLLNFSILKSNKRARVAVVAAVEHVPFNKFCGDDIDWLAALPKPNTDEDDSDDYSDHASDDASDDDSDALSVFDEDYREDLFADEYDFYTLPFSEVFNYEFGIEIESESERRKKLFM